ncbi:MAG: acyl-CoA dehydrogenase [Rhizorhabdus sp.]|jgi:alkylation response protein AidB-like acyl-CoA dehydrogenase|nr:MAG: acyl-CoA dehydrogenase [Rhizorhabdus sp.]
MSEGFKTPKPDVAPSLLTHGEANLRDEARDAAARLLAPDADGRNERGGFPNDAVDALGRMGFMGLLVPSAFGGRGCGILGYSLALEEIAAVDAGVSTTMHVHSLGATLMLARFGTEAQKARYLPEMAAGRTIGSFVLTEPQAGSDAAAIRTVARRDGDDFVITGSKHLITNGKTAGVVLVWALTDPALGREGITAFIVPTDTPGYDGSHVDAKMGQHSSETVRVELNECRVPAANILGVEGRGFRHAMSGLADGRIAIAAQAVGIAQAAYAAALDYARSREAYGAPIIKLQAIQFRLADMATQIEIARNFYISTAAQRQAGHDCIREASMAKLFASEMAEKVCSDALQIFGGNGYLREYRVERYCRDVRVTQIYEGTSDIQRLIIGRDIARSPLSGE